MDRLIGDRRPHREEHSGEESSKRRIRNTGTILVGVDGSESSIEALVWSNALGKRTGMGVTAAMAWEYPARCGVVGSGRPECPPDQKDREVINTLERITGSAGCENAFCLALRGPARQALERAANRPKVRMLVLGTRGLGPIDGLLLGSVSRSLLFSAKRPLVLVPCQGGRLSLDRIVVGLDGSRISGSVAAWSAELCRDAGAAATVVRCVDHGAEHSRDRLRETVERSQVQLETGCCGAFRGAGVEHAAIATSGDARRCLIEVAKRQQAGLIVIGQRGGGHFDGLGGTASYLVRHSPLPVAIIPLPLVTETWRR